jgi:hypothetical protein
MNMRNAKKQTALIIVLPAALALAASGTAQAGRGGSPQDIQAAIAANSEDAIQAELEHTEYLVCASCTQMVLPLVDHTSYRVRQAAAWWLVRRATSRQVYVSMLTRLSQPDSVLARNAADVLGEFGFPSAIPALGAALSNPVYTGEARAAMAKALGSIGRPEAATPLVAGLSTSDPLVKAASLIALRSVQGFRDGTVAAPLLSDADAQVRAEAAVSIGMFHSQAPSAVSALVTALASDPSAIVRRKAAWALGAINAPASSAGAGLQAAAASDANPLVRSIAAAAVTRLSQ